MKKPYLPPDPRTNASRAQLQAMLAHYRRYARCGVPAIREVGKACWRTTYAILRLEFPAGPSLLIAAILERAAAAELERLTVLQAAAALAGPASRADGPGMRLTAVFLALLCAACRAPQNGDGPDTPQRIDPELGPNFGWPPEPPGIKWRLSAHGFQSAPPKGPALYTDPHERPVAGSQRGEAALMLPASDERPLPVGIMRGNR